jgi:enoyl-CoA hydratase/carnithine racemase
MGPQRVRDLVTAYAERNPGFKVPRRFGPWTIPNVFREDRGDVAVLTIKRPRTLNALTVDTWRQLDVEFSALRFDPKIRGAVLTGFGPRAFTSGVDVRVLASIRSPEEAARMSREIHQVMLRIERLGKPVVCAMNGLALGAGSELAYACSTRIARKGLPVLFGHPEVRLGLVPGAGGSQRLPRLIDFPTAWRILRRGGTLSSADALRLGLIREEVEGGLVDRAVELARTLPPLPGEPRPVDIPATLPEVDLGGLSRRVDEILRRAVLVGATLPLERALEHEVACFAEVFRTRDCRIGLENYLKTGPRHPAPFVHS